MASRWHGQAMLGKVQPVGVFATGMSSLDRALGTGGIPLGRLTEIFGERSSGKTTLAYGLLARCTKAGDLGAWIDPEKSFFAPAAEPAGVVLERLIVIRPRDEAGCRRAADALVRSGACSIVVLDGASCEALQAHHCARLVSQAEKTGTILLALSRGHSQPLAAFASLRIRTCGLAPCWQAGRHAASDSRLAGYAITCNVVKSKVSAPGGSAALDAAFAEVAGSWPQSPSQHLKERFDRARAL
jgi:hypothetical protein